RLRPDATSDLHVVPWWTGVIYHARVTAVKRAEEVVTLSVAELTRGHGAASYWPRPPLEKEIRVNAQFPVCTRKHGDMSLALQIVQDALSRQIDHNGTSISMQSGST